MSSTRQFFPGTGDGKAPAEKSKFAQTCNRLSLFLKEKGNLRDINFEINAKFDPKGVSELHQAKAATVDLLSNVNMNVACGEEKAPQPKKSENKLPEYVILDSSVELDDSTHNNNSSGSISKAVTKSKTGQMTIFYEGKVMVVDDVPEDRARYVMLVAKNGVPDGKLPAADNKVEKLAGQMNGDRLELKDSDLPIPIARRASLNKFLAKRKDRATVRAAPYQVHNQSPGASSSGNEHSFDLNM